MDSLHRVRRSTLARSLRARRFPNSVGERKRKERAASSAMKKLRIAYGILRCSPKALRVTRARCRVRATSNSGEFRWRTRGRNGRRARAPVWSLSSPGETRGAYARRNRGHACMHMHPSSLPSHPPPLPLRWLPRGGLRTVCMGITLLMYEWSSTCRVARYSVVIASRP